MPPKSARRGGGAAAAAAAARKGPGMRSRAVKAQPASEEAAPVAKEVKPSEEAAPVAVEVKPAVEAAPVAEEVKPAEEAPKVEEQKGQPLSPPQQTGLEKARSDAAANGTSQYDGTMKETYGEEGKGERLEFEDDAEYEEVAVDYDEKNLEQYEEQYEDGDEELEYTEELVEEETDIVEEELVDGEEYENVEEEPNVDVEDENHHEMVKAHRKRKEFEVFVGGLDKDATESDLKKVFGEVGEITEVRLMMNPATNKNKGFAFLRYATVEQARRAVSELKNPLVRGKQCGVAPSHDNDTLFVGNICKTWTKEHLKEKLKNYEVDNFDDLILVEDSNNPGMNRGYALLEFSTRPEAMVAFRRLQKKDVVFGVNRTAKVSFADSHPEVDDEMMAQVRTVFLDGLPPSWDEGRVKKYLKKYGAIEKVELARNMPAAKRKDFGFVTFDTHDNAVACADGITNSEIGEGDCKAKVRARLSRPVQRAPRTKHGLRGNFRIGHGAPRGGHFQYARPPPPRIRPGVSRLPPIRSRPLKRHIDIRDRRPVMSIPDRVRRLPPPERSYVRRPPAPVYPKRSPSYGRREEFPPPRGRATFADYSSRDPVDRHHTYRDDYSPRGPAYSDLGHRSAPRISNRRAYADDGYVEKIDRPLPTYRVGRARDYDTISGSKRSYVEMDDAPPRYHDISVRQPKARYDYDAGGSGAQYADAYTERLGRTHAGDSGSRPVSGHDPVYNSRRHGMSYEVSGSASRGDAGGIYSSDYSADYMPRGLDVAGRSYSSGRNTGSSSGYLGGRGSSSYY